MSLYVGKTSGKAAQRRIRLGIVGMREHAEDCLVVLFEGFRMDSDVLALLPLPDDVGLARYEKAGRALESGKTYKTLWIEKAFSDRESVES